MLQIIGWLGCFYLLIKGLEIGNSQHFRAENGRVSNAGAMIAVLAIFGAIVFAAAFLLQGDAFPNRSSGATPEAQASELSQCIQQAKTPDAAAECVK